MAKITNETSKSQGQTIEMHKTNSHIFSLWRPKASHEYNFHLSLVSFPQCVLCMYCTHFPRVTFSAAQLNEYSKTNANAVRGCGCGLCKFERKYTCAFQNDWLIDILNDRTVLQFTVYTVIELRNTILCRQLNEPQYPMLFSSLPPFRRIYFGTQIGAPFFSFNSNFLISVFGRFSLQQTHANANRQIKKTNIFVWNYWQCEEGWGSLSTFSMTHTHTCTEPHWTPRPTPDTRCTFRMCQHNGTKDRFFAIFVSLCPRCAYTNQCK